jgi:hypothetical protein
MESVDGDGGLGTPAIAMSLVATSTPPVNRRDHWNEHEHGTPVTPAGNVDEGGGCNASNANGAGSVDARWNS